MGGWNQGKGKQKTQWWTHWDGAYHLRKDKESAKGKGAEKKKEQKGNKGDKEPDKAFSFPDYDFSSSSTSSSSKQLLEEEVKKEVLKCLKASGVEPSLSLSELLNAEPEQLSNLKEEQKALNLRKKLLLKIEKIKKRMKQKKDAWEVFEATVQEHVSKQVAKHKEDMDALAQELKTTEEEVSKLVTPEEEMPQTLGEGESMEVALLRKQLGESQAQLFAVQARFDAYLTSAGSAAVKMDPNSPQLVRPPGGAPLPIPVDSPEEDEAKKRRIRMEMVHSARAVVETNQRERSPRRDGSNSLERLDK